MKVASIRRERVGRRLTAAALAAVVLSACQGGIVDGSAQGAERSASGAAAKAADTCRHASFASGVAAKSRIPTDVVVDLSPFSSIDEALAAARDIDWHAEPREATAITLAYAAKEIRDHLASIGIEASINGASEAARSSSIVLAVDPELRLADDAHVDATEGYRILPVQNHLCVTAPGRIGALYGAYRLLEEIGFAWHDPRETLRPDGVGSASVIAWKSLSEVPRIGLRGFWIFAPTPEPFLRWMARNRLNIAGTGHPALRYMLGIRAWGGGHHLIQEEFSKPGLFEQHPDWFGQLGGVRRPIPANGFFVNPSFASETAAEYFASRLVERLEHGDLRDMDVLNLWPADYRFGYVFDGSAAARALGNETDNLLFFYANVHDYLRKAFLAGRLSRSVRLAGISYYTTWKPPTNSAVVSRLENTDYLHVFYTNERSFAAPMGRGSDASNRQIERQIQAWQSAGRLGYGVVEYYNYSVYGAVVPGGGEHTPLDFEVLTRGNSALFAYMHPPDRNPGPLRLANAMLSKLMWRPAAGPSEADAFESRAARIRDDYFRARYGAAAAEWADVWSIMQRSVSNTKQLFGDDGLTWALFQEVLWSQPWYSRSEILALIPRFRHGGLTKIPGRWSTAGEDYASDFLGLDASIALQSDAQRRWEEVLGRSAATLDPAVRSRMLADVEWFRATASRYRLMAASCDYFMRRGTTDAATVRERMLDEIQFLESAPVLRDTISPVNQRDFLRWHRQLAGLAIPAGADY